MYSACLRILLTLRSSLGVDVQIRMMPGSRVHLGALLCYELYRYGKRKRLNSWMAILQETPRMELFPLEAQQAPSVPWAECLPLGNGRRGGVLPLPNSFCSGGSSSDCSSIGSHWSMGLPSFKGCAEWDAPIGGSWEWACPLHCPCCCLPILSNGS